MSPPLKTGGPRSQLLAAIRAEELKLERRAEALQIKALKESERARELRAAAGRAGPLGRRVRLWLAHRLEAKAAGRLQVLINQRRIAKVDEAPQGGHRAARRRLDRESS